MITLVKSVAFRFMCVNTGIAVGFGSGGEAVCSAAAVAFPPIPGFVVLFTIPDTFEISVVRVGAFDIVGPVANEEIGIE